MKKYALVGLSVCALTSFSVQMHSKDSEYTPGLRGKKRSEKNVHTAPAAVVAKNDALREKLNLYRQELKALKAQQKALLKEGKLEQAEEISRQIKKKRKEMIREFGEHDFDMGY